METCKTIVLAQPEAGNSVNYEIPTNETGQLTFGPEQISGLAINDFGGLDISFADGGSATLTNFQDLVDNGNLLYLNDGTLIDPAVLTGALSAPQELATSDILTIVGPADNVTREINLEPGQKYVLDFDFAQPETAEVIDGNMVITFANEGVLVLNDFESATDGELPAELTLASSNTIVSGEELLTSLQLAENAPAEEILALADEEEVVEDVRKTEVAEANMEGEDAIGAGDETGLGYDVAAVEPASGTDEDLDSIAEALQLVEPAAGEAGAAGGRGGFGFGSTTTAAPLGGIDDVGPINPTQLGYDAPEFTPERIDIDEQSPAGPINSNPIFSGPFTSTLDETALAGAPLTDTGQVLVNFGNDGPGTILPNGTTEVLGSLPNPDLESGGEVVTISEIIPGYFGGVTGEGYIGTTPGGDVVFTVIIDPETGEYTYTQFEPFDHADGNDDNDVITLEFGVTATDRDGDQTSTKITVNVLDDAPADVTPDENTVSEDLLKTGDIVINDTLVVDFGQDVDGTVTPTGTAPTTTGVTTLTSGGDIITITPTTDGYIGTLPGGDTAFTLVIDPTDGSYVYTQKVPFDHDPANDTIGIEFPVTVTDFDGDTTETTIKVNITDSAPEFENDTPTLGNGLEVVDETDLPGVTTTGQLVVDFGADVPGAVTANDTFSFEGSALNGDLTSGGETVNVTLVGDTYIGHTGTDPNSNQVFTLQVSPDGAYTFDLLGTLDHDDPNDPNDIIDLKFGVTATDGDGDTATTTITIKVKDDVPTIGDARGDVDESGLDLGPVSTSDVIDVSLGVEIGSISPDGNIVATVGGNPIALESGGEQVVFEQTTDGYKGTINGGADTVFEVTIEQDGTYTYTQYAPFDHPDGTNPNDLIDIEFGVQVVSTDGDNAAGTVTISVADDGPVANDDVNGAEEGQTITGSVTANDELSEDVDNTVTQVEFDGTVYTIVPGIPAVVDTPVGQLTLNADGSYEFDTVDNGDPDATVTFTYTLVDSDGDSDTAELSVTVTPDGQPVAVTAEMTVDETNLQPGPLVINESMNVDFGLDGQGSIDPNGTTAVNGSVAGGSLTSEGRPVEIVPTANGYQGVVTGTNTVIFELIVQDNGDYSFELFDSLDHADATDPNDLIQLDFGVTVSDSDGDTAPGTITINVLDDAPVALSDVNNFDTTGGSADGNVVTGRNGGPGAEDILSEDADNNVVEISFGGNTETIPQDGSTVTIEGDFGFLEIDQSGEYTYTLKPGVTMGSMSASLDPAPSDVAGTQDSILKNGITVTSVNGGDLTFTDGGIGIQDGGGSDRVFGNDEKLNVTFGAAEMVEITMGDLANNPGSAMDFTLYLSDGSTRDIEISTADFTLVNGEGSVTFDASNYGSDLTITGVDVFSHDTNSSFGKTSFSLVDVEIQSEGIECIHDQFEYVLQDGDGDRDTATLDLKGKDLTNNVPVIVEPITETVDETNLGPIMEEGTVQANFFGEGPGKIEGNDTFTSTGSKLDDTLTHNGVEVTVEQVDDKYIGTAGTVKVFELQIEMDGDYTFQLFEQLDHADGDNPNDIINLNFGVKATDKDGDMDDSIITIRVKDDAPTAKDDSASTVEGGVITGKNVTDNDDDGEDTPATVVKVTFSGTDYAVPTSGTQDIPGQFGTLTIAANGDYTYTVTDTNNPDGVDTFTYTLEDFDGDQDTADLDIKVSPKNDVPVIVDPAEKTVDETNLGPIEVKGEVDANFFSDTPGAISGNDIFTSGGSRTNDTLTHNGVKVEVNQVGNTYVGAAGTVEVFTLEILENGDFTFTLLENLDHADGDDDNDIIELNFGVEAKDSDGDKDTSTITINVKDDVPVIYNRTGWVQESDLRDGGVIEITRGIGHDYGEDGPGSIDVDGRFQMLTETNGTPQQLTSDGQNVTVTPDGNGYVGKLDDGTVAFTLTVDPADGTHTYKQFVALDHFEGQDPADDVFWLKFGVTISDFDGDTDTAWIIVDVNDDEPVIDKIFKPVDETNLVDGPLMKEGTVPHSFNADGPGAINVTGNFTATYEVGGNNQTLTSMGVAIVVAANAAATGYVGKANGQTIFELNIDPDTGAYKYTQYEAIDHPDATDPNDVIWLKFEVQITDADGDTDTAIIGIDVKDDAPEAHTDVNVFDDTMTTGNVIAGVNGGDNSADKVSQDDPTLVNQISFGDVTKAVENGDVTIDGKFGSLEIDANGDYKYTLFDQPVVQEKQTVYTFNKDHPSGGDDAGDIKNVNTSYNETTQQLTFTMTVEDSAEGFTLALNDGPNPKGHADEMALFYFDASGNEPVVTVYNYNGENTQTSWTGDEIASSLNGNSPFTSITATSDGNGNVVYSFTVDAEGINNFSNDPDWTGAQFSDELGIWLHPVSGLNTSYDHDGYLTGWHIDHQSWYDTSHQPTHVEVICPCEKDFEPDAHDIGNHQRSLTLDGITVTVGDPQFNSLDKGFLSWVDKGDGAGIGIDGNGSQKVWRPGETLEVTFDDAVSKVTMDFADIGANDAEDGLDFLVYVDGKSEPIEYEFDIGTTNPQNGVIMNVEFNAEDFGGEVITQIDVFSINNSHLGQTSFLLNSIHAECPPEVIAGTDIFEYQIVDFDGDADSAFLVFNNGSGEAVNGTKAAETLHGSDLDDVIFGSGGDDTLFGGAGDDVFLFLSADDGLDTIKDFGEGDTIDLSQLLEEYNPVDDAINDFVYLSTSGGDTTISVDTAGSGNPLNAVDIAVVENTVIDISDLVNQNNGIV